MSTYKAVIIGLTGIGASRPDESSHLPIYGRIPRSHAAAYYRHPQTEVVGVCDIRQETLDNFRQNWHDVWPDMRYYTDYREMLEREQPDLVSVATPDHLHADITVDAANGSARAILCEKPIATTLADADRMIAAAEANNVLLSIEHTRRWDPRFHAARELIRSGEIGPLRSIVTSLYSARSMLFRNGTHMVDTTCFFAESNPQWLFAELEEGFDHFTEYKGDGGHDPATDPAASAYIHFANGVRAFYNSIKIEMPGSQHELICERGRIEVSDRELTVIRGTSHFEWSKSTVTPDDYMHTFQLGAVAELIHVLEHGGELVSPGREGRKTLEIMLAILRSHQLGNIRVNLPLE
ncbi:MAG: Gfo/Idh/MocA family oxidoreductase [Candidatus Poribacteria bacterium]|nr:Gfo/Idh/MocA family oxidoreductase [Candidatus Poribacteria bacterium]